jgi:hypothetical protein
VFLNGDNWRGDWKSDQASGVGVYWWNDSRKRSRNEFGYKPKGVFDEDGKFVGSSVSSGSDNDSKSSSNKNSKNSKKD